MTDVAFNTASLVARFSGYRFRLHEWDEQERISVDRTDEAEWRRICGEIADAGFRTIEIWEAHASPHKLTARTAGTWRTIFQDAGLEGIGYAGSFNSETVAVCEWLGITTINGDTPLSVDECSRLARSSGVQFNAENHPEKTPEELLARIGGRDPAEGLGICIDTGWLGTRGADGPRFITACMPWVRHVHLKDVTSAGRHDTCRLGSGVVDLVGCLRVLRDAGYRGTRAWEDEPEDRNPLEIAVESRIWIEEHLPEIPAETG